jgi:hypothetical protein
MAPVTSTPGGCRVPELLHCPDYECPLHRTAWCVPDEADEADWRCPECGAYGAPAPDIGLPVLRAAHGA